MEKDELMEILGDIYDNNFDLDDEKYTKDIKINVCNFEGVLFDIVKLINNNDKEIEIIVSDIIIDELNNITDFLKKETGSPCHYFRITVLADHLYELNKQDF